MRNRTVQLERRRKIKILMALSGESVPSRKNSMGRDEQHHFGYQEYPKRNLCSSLELFGDRLAVQAAAANRAEAAKRAESE